MTSKLKNMMSKIKNVRGKMKLYSMVFAGLFVMFTILCYGLKANKDTNPNVFEGEAEKIIEEVTLPDSEEAPEEESGQVEKVASEEIAPEEEVSAEEPVLEEGLETPSAAEPPVEADIEAQDIMSENILFSDDIPYTIDLPPNHPSGEILIVSSEQPYPKSIDPSSPEYVNNEPPVTQKKSPSYNKIVPCVIAKNCSHDRGAPATGPKDGSGPYRVPGARINTGSWVKRIIDSYLAPTEEVSFDDDQIMAGMGARNFLIGPDGWVYFIQGFAPDVYDVDKSFAPGNGHDAPYWLDLPSERERFFKKCLNEEDLILHLWGFEVLEDGTWIRRTGSQEEPFCRATPAVTIEQLAKAHRDIYGGIPWELYEHTSFDTKNTGGYTAC